jgi:hypothetical protein
MDGFDRDHGQSEGDDGAVVLSGLLACRAEGHGHSLQRSSRHLPMLDVAQPDEHGEAVRREILRDLKSDSFVDPGAKVTGLLCTVISLLISITTLLKAGQRRCPRP